jgi:hypothetical protein
MGELVVGPARRGGRLSKTFPYNRKEEPTDSWDWSAALNATMFLPSLAAFILPASPLPYLHTPLFNTNLSSLSTFPGFSAPEFVFYNLYLILLRSFSAIANFEL